MKKLLITSFISVLFFSCTEKNHMISKNIPSMLFPISRSKLDLKIYNGDSINNKKRLYGSHEYIDSLYTASFIIKENDRYQCIYSSQNYDTFYEIYAKTDYEIDQRDNKEYLTSIEFSIINFKGPINIGFADTRLSRDTLVLSKNKKSLNIKLAVKGLSDKNYFKYDFPKTSKIEVDKLTKLIINRILMPLDESFLTNKPDIKKVKVFDNEFFYRSGLNNSLKRRNKVPGQYGHGDNYKIFDINSQGDFKLEATGRNGNCYSSILHIK